MKTDYVVRYVFFKQDEATYVDLAQYYREYLLARNQLPERPADDEHIPFYVELIGSIEKKKHFLGIPYRASEPLTTFEEAEIILSELQERGIQDIRLKLAGWFNGGMNHTLQRGQGEPRPRRQQGTAAPARFCRAAGNRPVSGCQHPSGFEYEGLQPLEGSTIN